METYSYDEKYLDDAMKNLAEAFDYAVHDCNMELGGFADLFIASGYANRFGKGNPSVVSGMSGTELVMDIIIKSGLQKELPRPKPDYSRSPEYWCGWILAYYQWFSGKSFKEILSLLPMNEIYKLYGTLHEASEDKFVDTANAIIERKSISCKLQRQRKLCGYSQRGLADKAGVNIRTLQQYELKAKDINKASVSTVMALCRVLGCEPDDILE